MTPEKWNLDTINKCALSELRTEIADKFGDEDPVVGFLDAAIVSADANIQPAAFAAGRRRLERSPCEACRRRPPVVLTRPSEAERLTEDPRVPLIRAVLRKGQQLGVFDIDRCRFAFARAGQRYVHSHIEGLEWNLVGTARWLENAS